MTDILQPQIGGGGDRLRQEFAIHRTDRMRIDAVFWVVPSSEPDRKHVSLRIEQYKKKPTDPNFPNEPDQKINLGEDDIGKLAAAVKAQTLLQNVTPGDDVVVLRGGDSETLRKLTERDITSIKQLVASLDDENIKKLAKIVNPQIVEKLESAVRYVKMEESLQTLGRLVNADTSEPVLQKWFDEHTWIFGKRYIARIPKRTIGLESRADLIYLSVDGFADLVELKKSTLTTPLLLRDASHNNYYPSADFSKALAQAMRYIQVMEDHRLQLVQLAKIPVLRPTVTIIMGRSHNWNEAMRDSLRILNSSLVNIKILTYDHLLEMGQSILNLYSPEGMETGDTSPDNESPPEPEDIPF